MAQHTGRVLWFNNAKGYGFIAYEGGPDVFCHFSGIKADGYKSLDENDSVEFDVVQGGSGRPQAENVRRILREKVADSIPGQSQA